jgi:hypothetical protein
VLPKGRTFPSQCCGANVRMGAVGGKPA